MSPYILTRDLFKRSLAFIYFIGFLILWNQSAGLIGSHGILPAQAFVERIHFWQLPSLFYFYLSDASMKVVIGFGLGLSVLGMSGFIDKAGETVSFFCWFCLWFFYLSFVNIGQIFYGFGWEILLLETGFLAIFLGSKNLNPPRPVMWLLRWVLFRIMFGAGLIKIRGDACWKNLSCMIYYYETQPMPNPISWYAYHWPLFVHKSAVLATHFVELVVPFGFFAFGRFKWIARVASLITIGFQAMLILTGNLSWLNFLTIALALVCLDDGFLKLLGLKIPNKMNVSKIHRSLVAALTVLILTLSVKPLMNMLSDQQIMNTSFDPIHLVNTYGAFGSITKKRMEIVIEGTSDSQVGANTVWKEYEFKGKPGDVSRRPPLVSPYHYKLDWQMWFAAMSSYEDHPWFLNLIAKLLKNEEVVLDLLRINPFPDAPPKFIRARWFEYHFTDSTSSGWWRRELRGEYLPPVSLKN